MGDKSPRVKVISHDDALNATLWDNHTMNTPVGPTLAAMVKEALEATGRAAREVSEKAGLGQTAVRDILSGRVQSPRLETIQALANELGRPIGPVAPTQGAAPVIGLSPSNARLAEVLPPRRMEMPKDVPVYGTAAGSGGDGAMMINAGDVVDWVRRPPGLVGKRGIYGLYVEGESMEPLFEHGDLIFVDESRKPKSGDRVVIVIANEDHDEAYVKILSRVNNDEVVVRQFNPAAEIKFSRAQVRMIHRVLSTAEMMGV